MKTLTLVRHAKSSWDDSSLSDRERPLNKRGERDAPMMGQRIVDAGIRPSLILSSPANRALTTARIIADKLSYPREFLQREKELYLASPQDMLDVLVAQDNGFKSIMLFAHNPGLTDLANFFVPGLTNNLPTNGVVCVNIDKDDWSFYERPKTELVLYDFPKNRP